VIRSDKSISVVVVMVENSFVLLKDVIVPLKISSYARPTVEASDVFLKAVLTCKKVVGTVFVMEEEQNARRKDVVLLIVVVVIVKHMEEEGNVMV
jgi:hypothetical protein